MPFSELFGSRCARSNASGSAWRGRIELTKPVRQSKLFPQERWCRRVRRCRTSSECPERDFLHHRIEIWRAVASDGCLWSAKRPTLFKALVAAFGPLTLRPRWVTRSESILAPPTSSMALRARTVPLSRRPMDACGVPEWSKNAHAKLAYFVRGRWRNAGSRTGDAASSAVLPPGRRTAPQRTVQGPSVRMILPM